MSIHTEAPPPSRSQREAFPRGTRSVGPWVRIRRIVLIACAVAMIPVIGSYAATMLKSSNASLTIRTIEWLRTNGGAGLVSKIETIYYSLTAPSKGGPQLKALPKVGVALTKTRKVVHHHPYRPPRIAPLARHALPGEGIWHATRAHAGQYPPLLVTTFRSDPSEYPRLIAGVAWIDPHRTKLVLYPGSEQPSVEMPNRGPEEVPPSARKTLLATFNSGFKYEDSNGGFALNGNTYAPMRAGQGTVIGYKDGKVNVIEWKHGPKVEADVAFATQNLPLIVKNGKPSPRLNDTAEWGATLGNAIRVWRSGIGITRQGDLIYAQADYQTAGSLARILIHAGAIRGMELDINSYWVSFNSYGAPGAQAPTKLLSETERPADRYLVPDERDFFAVFEKK